MELQEKNEKDEQHFEKLFSKNPKIKCLLINSRLKAI